MKEGICEFCGKPMVLKGCHQKYHRACSETVLRQKYTPITPRHGKLSTVTLHNGVEIVLNIIGREIADSAGGYMNTNNVEATKRRKKKYEKLRQEEMEVAVDDLSWN